MVLALVKSTFKEIIKSTPKSIAIITILVVLCFSIFMYLDSPWYDGRLPSEYLVPAVAAVAAGVIGNDSTGGIMPLIFARPISRTKYLVTKWASTILFSCLLMIILDGLQLSIASMRPEIMPDLQTILLGMGNQLFKCAGLSTVLVFFSTLLPSFGDVALYGGLTLAAQSTGNVGCWLKMPELASLGKDLEKFINPSFDLAQVFFVQYPSAAEIFTYSSQIMLFLAAAVIVINQKEIGYGAE